MDIHWSASVPSEGLHIADHHYNTISCNSLEVTSVPVWFATQFFVGSFRKPHPRFSSNQLVYWHSFTPKEGTYATPKQLTQKHGVPCLTINPLIPPSRMTLATALQHWRTYQSARTEKWVTGLAKNSSPTGIWPPVYQVTNHKILGTSIRDPPRLSDTCPHSCVILNKNVNGLGKKPENKLEKLIELMIEQNIHGYCLQETFHIGSYINTIRGHTVLHHGMNVQPDAWGRNSAGVMIFLGPDLTWAWARAGKLPPMHYISTSKSPGQIIGVTLSFPNRSNRHTDTFHRNGRGSIKLFLCSVYYTYGHDEQIEFYDDLDRFITSRPHNLEVLLGADVNCNTGIRILMFKDTLGLHGIRNRNLKGKDLLYILKSNNLKIILTYFQHVNYCIYRSFNIGKTPHMFDNFICCNIFFKRVTYCKTVGSGIKSYHSVI